MKLRHRSLLDELKIYIDEVIEIGRVEEAFCQENYNQLSLFEEFAIYFGAKHSIFEYEFERYMERVSLITLYSDLELLQDTLEKMVESVISTNLIENKKQNISYYSLIHFLDSRLLLFIVRPYINIDEINQSIALFARELHMRR